MKKLKLIGYVAIIFAAGLVCGGLLAFKLGPRLLPPPMMPDPAVVMQEELRSRLKLTPEQMQQIGPIIRDSMAGYRNQFVHETYVTINQTNAKISSHLTPEQLVKFGEFTHEQNDFLARYLGPMTPEPMTGPPGGPMGGPMPPLMGGPGPAGGH